MNKEENEKNCYEENENYCKNESEKEPVSVNKARKKVGIGGLRVMIFCSALAAISIVLDKYASIPIGNSLRIGFGNLPIIMAGMFFGPLAGIAVGAVADIVGGIMVYGIGQLNLIITLGFMLEGAIAGFIGKSLKPLPIIISEFSAHIASGIVIKTIGLWVYYKTPIETLVFRIPISLGEAAIESLILISILSTNKTVVRAIRGLKR